MKQFEICGHTVALDVLAEVFENAAYGGIAYWASSSWAVTQDEDESALDALVAGHSIGIKTIYAVNGRKKFEMTAGDLADGLEKAVQQNLVKMDVLTDMSDEGSYYGDAFDSDVIVQLALFGDVVFG